MPCASIRVAGNLGHESAVAVRSAAATENSREDIEFLRDHADLEFVGRMAIERVEVPVANTPDPDQIVRDADLRAEAALVLGRGFFFEALGVVLVFLPGGWTRMRGRDTVASDRERVDAGGQIAQDEDEVRLLPGSAIVEVAFGDPLLRAGLTEEVSKWVFQPLRVDGKPVPMTTELTIKFNLNP